MFDRATVTMPLDEFDELRRGKNQFENWYREMASRIAGCFEYSLKYTATDVKPGCDEECSTCGYCIAYTEKLTVDVERLINVAKDYSCWGKDIETDLDNITIERMERENEGSVRVD